MTIVNATQFNSPITIGVNTSILPNVAIDESSITYSSSHLFGRGRIYYGNYNYQASFSYYGNFNFNSQVAFSNGNRDKSLVIGKLPSNAYLNSL